jgi:FMN phosphatase YigB (HAD superfamily)
MSRRKAWWDMSSGVAEEATACAQARDHAIVRLFSRPLDEVVAALARRVPLAIATNCSVTLGRIAAERSGGPYAVVATAESVGYYKPRPEPYRSVLAKLQTEPARTLFVAGSELLVKLVPDLAP